MHRLIEEKHNNPFFIFTKKELTFVSVVFLLGIIVGATVITIYMGRDLDLLILENKELKTKIEEQEKQLGQLDKQFKNRLLVQTINPQLETDLNKHTQQEISKKIRNLLAGLIGKELKEIDPLLLQNIINEASIIVEGHTYQLQLSFLVISDQLSLYIRINNYKQGSEGE